MTPPPDPRPRWRAGLVEVGIVLAGFAVFTLVHGSVGGDVTVATADGRTLQSVERVLHLAVEHPANHWLAAHPVLITVAVAVYRLYYAAILGVLVWTFVRHPEVYRRARRTLLVTAALALPVFWAFPVSPPRFAQPGIVDIVARHDILGTASTTPGGHYSAMPSLHVGWSAWCAWAVWTALRPTHPRLARLAWLFPALMTAVVLTTGNHYALDVVGSAALVTLAVAVTARWQRGTARLDFERAPTGTVGVTATEEGQHG